MVAVVQQHYPKFDKTTLSKCEHDEAYGVQISRKALDALYEEYAPDMLQKVKRERDGRHRLTKRIACRLEDADHAALLKRIEADGYETTQDWLVDQVHRYMETKGDKQNGAKEE